MKIRTLLSWTLACTLGVGFVQGSFSTAAPGAPPDQVTDPAELSEEMIGLRVPPNRQKPAPRGDESTQGTTEQAVGFYADGSLVNPDGVADAGPGFYKLFLPRDRGWGTFDLFQVIRIAASRTQSRTGEVLDRLAIGDVSQKQGGEISGHASHRNGLDADLTYYKRDHREQDPNLTNGFDEIFVKDGKVTPNFDLERNWALVKALVGTGRIVRIFVDPVIKKTFCAHARKTGEYTPTLESLRRLRPLAAHDDHLHVRISCPLKSPRCMAQEPPAEGNGCAEVE